VSAISLPELFGVRSPSVLWERVLLFSAGSVVAKTAVFAVGYSISEATGTGFSISWLNFGPPWELLLILSGQFAELLVVIAVFRAVRRDHVALVVAVVTYGLLYTPVNLWLLTVALGPFQGSWLDVAVPRLATRVYYSLAFYGALMVALRRFRPLWLALFTGAVAGSLLGDIAAVLVQAASSPNPRLTTNLSLVAWGTPRTLVHACTFAGFLVWGLRFGRVLDEESAEAPRLSHPRFVGSYLGLASAAAAIVIPTRTLADLGRWPGWTSGTGASSVLVGATNGPVLALNTGGLIAGAAGGAVFVLLVYRAWAAIRDGHVRMSPTKAAGLLLVPGFNLYWFCALLYRLHRELDVLLDRHDAASATRRPSAAVFALAPPIVVLLALAGALLPFGSIAGLPCLVLVAIVMSRTCDAVNALPASPSLLPGDEN
jgi:hypothetical protein